MTQDQINKYKQAEKDGSLPRDENPLYLFADISTNLLVKIVSKDFNILELARLQLLERGVNEKGKWIGFEKAHQIIRSLTERKKAVVPRDNKIETGKS